ncbi:DNA recombination/repair protein RecA [Candidatus Aerophobetes bacterium]|nr:DNA recombination/repair protein RecA [Candidatus Aerophobetes bacterium]
MQPNKELDLIAKNIIKEFGEDALIFGRENDRIKDIERVPTGSFALDIITGGGYPKGRIIEIFGMDRVGKTFAGLICIAANQKQNKTCCFLDIEATLNYTWAEKIGVDTNSLIISRPSCAEEALEITDRLIRSGGVDLVVLDSVAALVSQEELDKDMSQETMAKQARLISKALRKFGAWGSKTGTTLILINQMRQDITSFYPRLTTPGGNAIRFWASLRLELKCTEIFSNKKGHRVKATVVKNKTAPPYLSATFDLIYNEPLVREREILHIASELDIIQKKGGGYYFLEKENLGRMNDAIDRLKKDKSLCEKIEAQVKELLL